MPRSAVSPLVVLTAQKNQSRAATGRRLGVTPRGDAGVALDVSRPARIAAVLRVKMDADMNVPLGTHQATRKRWKNECGYVTLDAFTPGASGGSGGVTGAAGNGQSGNNNAAAGTSPGAAGSGGTASVPTAGGGPTGAGAGAVAAGDQDSTACVCNASPKSGNRAGTALLTIGLALFARSFRRPRASETNRANLPK
jgi:hypothetical protein